MQHDELGRPSQGDPAAWLLARMAADATVVSLEGTCEALLGRSAAGLVGGTLVGIIHPDDVDLCRALGAAARAEPGAGRSTDHRVVRPDGSAVWVEATLTYDAATGEMTALLVDVSRRLAQEAALEASRQETLELAEEFRLLADEIPSGAFRADADGSILFANARFHTLAGTRDVTRLHELAAPADSALIDEALGAALGADPDPGRGPGPDPDPGAQPTGGPAAHDGIHVEFRARDGGRTLLLRLGAVRNPGKPGGTVVGVLIDATPTVELRTRARTDSLTGLLNRTALNEHLDAVLRAGGDVCVMFVDFDDFKHVNDCFGHHAGDEVLRVIGRRLRNAVRGSEEVGRYGGDEFVIVCTTVDPATVANLRARVEAVLSEPVHFDDSLWPPSASIGTATSVPGDTATSILRRADAEMYRAKRADGRR